MIHTDKVRVAVIGTGGYGSHHLESLARCPQAEIVAIAESHPERAAAVAQRFGVGKVYPDYRELVEQPDIDAVTIAVPNHLHAPVALAALRARKHVLVEKPMATNATDAAEMVDTAEKVGRKLMVSQNFRFHRQTQIARNRIESGALGEIYHAAGQWLRRAGIPRIGSWFTRKQAAGGGCTMDIGVHMIDTALYLLGEFDVTTVSAQTRAAFGPRGMGDGNWGQSEIDPAAIFDVEDFSVALLRLRSGRTVLLRTAWAANLAPEYREHHLELFGTEGGLGVFPPRLFRSTALGYESTELNLAALPYPEDRIHHFIQCIVEDSEPLVGMGESLQVQKVLDAIYQSAALGREVALG